MSKLFFLKTIHLSNLLASSKSHLELKLDSLHWILYLHVPPLTDLVLENPLVFHPLLYLMSTTFFQVKHFYGHMFRIMVTCWGSSGRGHAYNIYDNPWKYSETETCGHKLAEE